MTLSTARLRLRELAGTDFDWLHPIAASPAVTRYTDWGPNTPEDTRRFLEQVSAAGPDERTWAIVLPDGTGIGTAGLRVVSTEHRRASFGYLVDPDHAGRGYATEVAELLVGLAFTTLHLHRLEATCHPENAASRRVLEKAGLKREGLMRGHVLVRGTWRDSLLYAALPSDVGLDERDQADSGRH